MEIYGRPANAFVARFVGSPAMTMAPVNWSTATAVRPVELGDGTDGRDPVPRDGLARRGALRLGLRPGACPRGADGGATTTPRSNWSSGSASAP